MDKARLRSWLHIAALVVIVVLAIGLYKAKTDASQTQARVRALETQISETEASMRALRAEIATLESPARIEALAERHLGADMGSESAALPERAINARLPEPRQEKQR
jgi:cell division protein FtsL